MEFVILHIWPEDSQEACSQQHTIDAEAMQLRDWEDLIHCAAQNEMQNLRIRIQRKMLTEKSSYFRALFSNFREAESSEVNICWNLQSFCLLMQFIYVGDIVLKPHMVAPLIEGAIFYGVNKAIAACEQWTSSVFPAAKMTLDNYVLYHVASIWTAAHDTGVSSIKNICTENLAINFVELVSCKTFVDFPVMLLAACIDHPQLTVESEKQLCDAILNWCRHLGKWGDDSESVHLLQKVRISCLPVKYILGSIYGKVPFACFGVEGELALTCNDVDIWKIANDDNRFLLRLTKHSDVLDISGCQQITHSVLLLSALQRGNPMHTYSSHTPSHVRKLSSLCCGTKHNAQRRAPLLGESPVTNVKKMVISQCWRIKQEELISLLQASFPKLQELYAVNCPQIGAKLLLLLPTACPSIKVIDLSVDINDTLSQDVTVEKSISEPIHTSMENVWPTCNCPLSYLSTLSLQGHANLVDSDFLLISSRCPNIAEISINGCTSLSDLGISSFIKCHPYLQSIHSAFTAFGGQSLEALVQNLDTAKGASDIRAFRSLDISSCRGFSAGDMAKLLTLTSSLMHLALSNTVVDDNALYVLSSCCLKFLNLQDTQVSKQALTYVISKNPTLKRLNFRGCKNMKSEGHLEEPKVLDALLEKGVRQLECLEVGWGFSDCIFKTISPSVFSLRSLTLGLGTTISSSSLLELPILCPLLESITIFFQDISADIFTYWLRHLSNLMVFKLKHCLSDLPLRCINTFNEGFGSNLKCLKLEGSINCITDRELMILGKACERLSCFSITHCTRLSPNSLSIIAHNWRGLSELKVEECAQPTCEGASSLLDLCHALEILTLRHNGSGLPRSFISDAILKLPVLRNLSLDLCDCLEGGYETPHGSTWRSLLLVKLSRCKVVDNVFQSYTKLLKGRCRRDAIVLERSGTRLRTTIVKSKY